MELQYFKQHTFMYRNVCFPCEEHCSMYRCTEQTTQHLGTKRLQNKLVTTLEFHESIDHAVLMSSQRTKQYCPQIEFYNMSHWPRKRPCS